MKATVVVYRLKETCDKVVETECEKESGETEQRTKFVREVKRGENLVVTKVSLKGDILDYTK